MKVLWCYLEFFLRNKHLAVTQEPLSTSESTVHYHIQYADKRLMHHILNQTNSTQTFKLSFLLYISIAILLPTPKPLLFPFLDWNLYVYIWQKACCVSNPSHSPYMGKRHKICTLSLQNSSHAPFICSILDPNILLSSWFSDIISLHSSFWIRGVKV